MLVLARKKGESIKIGGNITVEVVSIAGNTVKLGIEAPENVGILRSELYELIKNENISASAVNLADLDELNKISIKKIDK